MEVALFKPIGTIFNDTKTSESNVFQHICLQLHRINGLREV